MSDLDAAMVGDDVALVSRIGWHNRVSIKRGVIERVTKTQVTALDGRRFNKKTGEEIGVVRSRFHIPPRLQFVTKELLSEVDEEIKTRKAEAKCRAWEAVLAHARDGDAVRIAAMLPDVPKDIKDA